MSVRDSTANETRIKGRKQMQQASSTEIQNVLQKTVQAFQEMKYPVTKNQLIDKAKSLNANSEVIQNIETIPDKEYHSASDVLQDFKDLKNGF